MLNINIGIFGHVDSGKTTLARALSTISSTAAFDKHPQSKERGITIDLGFSAVITDLPHHLQRSNGQDEKLQLTFVDCPGHSTLIKTVIGGVHIIDFVLLVIDVQKGIQTQTAECLVISEITSKNLVIVINKIDLLDETVRDGKIEKLELGIRKTFKSTMYGFDIPIIKLSALKGINVNTFLEELKKYICLPVRDYSNPFLFAADHFFSVKGKGTVCTGTVLQGKVSVNDLVEIPICKEMKKVKSIQSFHQPVQSVGQGDRAGICFAQLNPDIKRGFLCEKGYVKNICAAVINFKKIKYYKYPIKSETKYHVSFGYETVKGKIILFRNKHSKLPNFDCNLEYEYVDEYSDALEDCSLFALIEFETSILSTSNGLVIGSKLDINPSTNSCRLAFSGCLQWVIFNNSDKTNLKDLKIFKEKSKQGFVCRIINANEVIVDHLFKKGTTPNLFIGKKVTFSSGEEGTIENTFGQSTKLKVSIANSGLSDSSIAKIKLKQNNVLFQFKRYIFNKDFVS